MPWAGLLMQINAQQILGQKCGFSKYALGLPSVVDIEVLDDEAVFEVAVDAEKVRAVARARVLRAVHRQQILARELVAKHVPLLPS